MSILKKLTSLIFISFIIVACSNADQFKIKKGNVGLLNINTKVDELGSIFKKDSLVSKLSNEVNNEENNLFSLSEDVFTIYSKSGAKMLEISPEKQHDSLSKIKSVEIFDANYKTEKGLSLKSTFKEINENYKVNKVETTLTSATLFIDELNATVAIDKKELGLNPFSREEIKIDQIPDMAKIKYFTIWFN